MFRRPTVFILGAGASWHYGYPTGERLVEIVKDKAQIARECFAEMLSHYARGLCRFEKSTRNCYDPLALGFDEAEEFG